MDQPSFELPTTQAEDTVEYEIYIDGAVGQNSAFVQACKTTYMTCLEKYLEGYIWQKEPFALRVAQARGEMFLQGSTAFGDNIEDEWFIVFLLTKLSQQFPEITVHVSDSDGYFLLIEAALVIPSWLSPDNSDSRVFVRAGEVHIIPLPTSPALIPLLPVKFPSRERAVQVIREGKVDTLAAREVQEAIKKKLAPFPLPWRHTTPCWVPEDIARILAHEPSLISPVVEAFYYRDPIDLRACRRMSRFPPRPSAGVTEVLDGGVTTMVTFTRCLYAQMQQQRFFPPKVFKLPPPTHEDYDMLERGMKVACGMEMLYLRGDRLGALARGTIDGEAFKVATYPFDEDPQWAQYRGALQERGYFAGELEGSKRWRELLATAKEFFLDDKRRTTQDATEGSEKEDIVPDHAIVRIKEILANHPKHAADCPVCCRAREVSAGDSDAWLTLDMKNVDDMLRAKQAEFDAYDTGRGGDLDLDDDEVKEEQKTRRAAKELEEMVKGMTQFVGQESDFTGAELPREDGGGDEVAFNMQKFLSLLGGADSWVPSDEPTPPEKDFYDPLESDDDALDSDDSEDGLASEDDDQLREVMAAMDQEIGVEIGLKEDFVRGGGRDDAVGDDDGATLQPVNVDLNLVQNFLDSFSSQHGEAGPVSNLLGAMGISLPDKKDE